VRGAFVAEVVSDPRCSRLELGVLLSLAVEEPERVALEAVLRLDA